MCTLYCKNKQTVFSIVIKCFCPQSHADVSPGVSREIMKNDLTRNTNRGYIRGNYLVKISINVASFCFLSLSIGQVPFGWSASLAMEGATR